MTIYTSEYTQVVLLRQSSYPSSNIESGAGSCQVLGALPKGHYRRAADMGNEHSRGYPPRRVVLRLPFRFVRRLLWFFMPSSKLFVSMKPDHPRARQTTVVGCELIEFLLDSEEVGSNYLSAFGCVTALMLVSSSLVMNHLGPPPATPFVISSTDVLANHIKATPIEILLAQPESNLFAQ